MPPPIDFEPPARAHALPLVVADADIDDLGHANNVVWVRWVNEAAIAHSVAVGFGPEVYRELGLLWVVRRHDVEYLRSAMRGDALKATTWVASWTGATSLRRTVIHRDDGVFLFRAETTWALIDAATGRPRRVPEEMRRRYGLGEQRDGVVEA
jgi:acyl-CoA thioester hydrolase